MPNTYWRPYPLDEAFRVAGEVCGYPCGIRGCSYNCWSRYGEMHDLAYDLAGYPPVSREHSGRGSMNALEELEDTYWEELHGDD